MQTLSILAPETVHDLPLDKARWDQQVVGYDLTIVSGVVTFEGGVHTGAMPGSLIREHGHRRSSVGVLPDPPPRFSGYRRVPGEEGRTTKDEALAQSLEAESGISNQSRIADAVDEETRKAKL